MKKEKAIMNPSLTDYRELSQVKELLILVIVRLLEPELIKGFLICEYLEPVSVFSGEADKTIGTAVT